MAIEVVGERSPWRRTSVRAAAVVMLAGLAIWMPDLTPAQDFADTAPALFRLGASFLGGFFIGWILRRFVKTTALIAGAVIVAITVLQQTGWKGFDWAAAGQHVKQSLTWLHGEAQGVKHLLTGYLPSAGAGAVGLFLGFRRK